MSWSEASKKYYYSEKGRQSRIRYQEKLKLKKQKAKEELKKQEKPINNTITLKQKTAPTKKLKK